MPTAQETKTTSNTIRIEVFSNTKIDKGKWPILHTMRYSGKVFEFSGLGTSQFNNSQGCAIYRESNVNKIIEEEDVVKHLKMALEIAKKKLETISDLVEGKAISERDAKSTLETIAHSLEEAAATAKKLYEKI